MTKRIFPFTVAPDLALGSNKSLGRGLRERKTDRVDTEDAVEKIQAT